MKPRILLLSPVVPYPPTDGGRLRTYKLCKALMSKYDFTIIARVNQDDIAALERSEDDFVKKISLVGALMIAEKPGGTESQRSSFFRMLANKYREWSDPWRGMPHGISYSVDPVIKHLIGKCLKEDRYELIHVDRLYMAQYVTGTGGIPAILTEPDIEYEKFKGFLHYRREELRGKAVTRLVDRLILSTKAPLQLRWVRSFESSLSNRFKLCIVASENDKKRLQAVNPDLKIVVVPNGVDVSYFVPFEASDESPTLTFTGHMGYFPNEDAILYFCEQIFPRIREALPAARLNIVGKSPSEMLLELARRDATINVVGFVEDVRPYMASNFIYVVPLRIGSGTRLKILEALAMKMAVVSTSVGCEGLEVEDGKNIIIADDPRDFADKVVELFGDPDKRRCLGESGRSLVKEKYDWHKIAEIQDAAYQEVLNSRSQRNAKK